jgi:hypothetical protein
VGTGVGVAAGSGVGASVSPGVGAAVGSGVGASGPNGELQKEREDMAPEFLRFKRN